MGKHISSKKVKTKLVATIISVVSAVALLAVGVFATLTNFSVTVKNQLSIQFDAVDGVAYATRVGDVCLADNRTDAPNAVVSESTTATDWTKIYDVKNGGEIADAISSIAAPVNYVSNSAIENYAKNSKSSISITYYFYYELDTTKNSSTNINLEVVSPALADTPSALKITYAYMYATSASLPTDWSTATALTDGDNILVNATNSKVFVKADATLNISSSVTVSSLNWTFNLTFGVPQYALNGDRLQITEVAGAETYELWAKEVASATTSATEAGGALMLAAVGDTDATLGTLVKVLAKSEISNIDLTTALSTLTAGTYKLTVVPKNTSGVEIAGSRVAVKYTLVPKITLTFKANAGSANSYWGITGVLKDGTNITTLTVERGLTLKQILEKYGLTLDAYGGYITATNFDSVFTEKHWNKGSNLNVTFVQDTEIIFNYTTCFTADTDVLCYDEKKKKFYKKKIKDITYSDLVACWDFDNGKLTYSKVIWIRKPESKQCLIRELTFTGGTKLTIVDEHMMFVANKGKFVTDFEVGDQFMNEKGEYITLTKIEESYRTEVPYAIATNYHINCFTGGVVGSLGYNNLYPIKDRKFVKDNRKLRPFEEFDIPREFYDGFRVAEINDRTAAKINKSVNEYFVKNMLPKE